MTRRQWAAALCGLFALILALSGLMVMAHLGHSCLGEDCPLCAALSHWELLRRLGALAALVCLALSGATASKTVQALRRAPRISFSLVSLGVKLSN